MGGDTQAEFVHAVPEVGGLAAVQLSSMLDVTPGAQRLPCLLAAARHPRRAGPACCTQEEGASDLRINVTIRAFATNPDGTPAPVPAPPAAAQDNSGSGSGDGGSSGSGSSEPAAKRRRA